MELKVNSSSLLNSSLYEGNKSKYDLINVKRLIANVIRMLNEEGISNLKSSQALHLINLARSALAEGNYSEAERVIREAMKYLKPLDEMMGKRILNEGSGGENDRERGEPVDDNKAPEGVQAKRKYQDVSNEGDVSFQYPTPLNAGQSFIAVPAHERQHVANSISGAILDAERVLTIVSYRLRYDPNTGEPYLAGGTTRTIHLPHYERKKTAAKLGENINVIL